MDPGNASTALTSTAAGSSGSSGSEKPGLGRRRHPPVLRMVLEALRAGEQRQGTSVAAIKLYVLHKYPTVDTGRFRHLLKQALASGVRQGLLVRPANSKARGATGSFKLVPKHKRAIQSRKKPTPMAPRRAGEAKEKAPKKPSKTMKDTSDLGKVEKVAKKPGEVRKAPPKPGAAREKAFQKGSKAKNIEAKLGEARKGPPKLDKATQAPSRANGLSRKPKVKGSRSSRGAAEAHGKTKAGSKSSKPTANKVKNGAASPTKKKMGAQALAPKGAAALGAEEGPKARGAAPAKGSEAKVAPAQLARKTEAPKGWRRPGLPTKALSSKVSSKKAKAEI
ncbi:histone H1.8 [Cynocephalus volans]|uniref:histone H1.8 n=1 Tax=Cynocephalus volans TaxID=110931 RepID=UPI002FCC8DCB